MRLLFEEFNKTYRERFDHSIEQVATLVGSVQDSPYELYFKDAGAFILKMGELEGNLDEYFYTSKSLEELKAFNRSLYKGLIGEQYNSSFANPDYCVKVFGESLGQALSFIYTRIRDLVSSIFEGRIVEATIINELFLDVYNALMNDESEKVINIIQSSMLEDLETRVEIGFLRQKDPNFKAYKSILLDADLSDNRYLYRYGKFITDNELKSADYIRTLDIETIKLMADTKTNAFVTGYKNGNKEVPLDEKGTIHLVYQLGFERVEREVAMNFAKMALESMVFDLSFTSPRNRLVYSLPNKQYAYDHRQDMAIFFNDVYADAYETAYANVLEKHQETMRLLAGPALSESFGSKPFAPVSKVYNIKYNDSQNKRKTAFDSKLGRLSNGYLPRSAFSFVIITYPLPEIGDQYKEIFQEIIKVNTLDAKIYEQMHDQIIDTLDLGEYVHIKGNNGNHTDLKVMLYELTNPDKETIFENCCADVNVPVGEVFTSPKLTGTEGVLHVTEVFLKGLKYVDIELTFKDGMISNYTCKNFGDDEEANKKYVYENLIHPHDTLPIGEFAIGTNTTAYMMAKKYQIADVLPILIAEKLGPHFAIGDTCFTMSEDVAVYNPNGKEIVARDNEVSCKRKTEPEKAYTFKHTDITIPYDEIGHIEVITKEGSHIAVIKDGRFVLSGTEALNEPFN